MLFIVIGISGIKEICYNVSLINSAILNDKLQHIFIKMFVQELFNIKLKFLSNCDNNFFVTRTHRTNDS